MKKILSTVLAAAALLFTPSNASAQDCCCETLEGAYVGLLGGVSWANDLFTVDSSSPGEFFESEFDTGWNIAGFIGYRCCNGIRVEFEAGYRELDLDKLSQYNGSMVNSITSFSKSDFSLTHFMANFLFECSYQACGCCWRPYFGFGIGGALVDMNISTTSVSDSIDDDDTVFAYQLIVGLAYPINECMDLAVEYRFFGYDEIEIKDTTGAIDSSLDYGSIHNIVVSVKYIFGGLW